MSPLNGRFQSVQDEGMKNLMIELAKKIGKEDDLKNIDPNLQIVVEININNNTCCLTSEALGKAVVKTFTFGGEFDDHLMNGKPCKSVASITDNKLHIKSTASEITGQCEYVVNGDELTMIAQTDKTTTIGKTIFKRI